MLDPCETPGESQWCKSEAEKRVTSQHGDRESTFNLSAAPSVEIYGTLDSIVFFPQRNASILVAGHPHVCHCVISIQDWKGFLFEGGGYAFPLFNMLHCLCH